MHIKTEIVTFSIVYVLRPYMVHDDINSNNKVTNSNVIASAKCNPLLVQTHVQYK